MIVFTPFMFISKEEKEYKDYHNAMVEKQKGQPNHLFLGHGLDQKNFEKREFATSSNLAFGSRQTTD